MAIKFNDYFEFPREFDMAPYTAAVLSEVDRANTADPSKNPGEVKVANSEEDANCTKTSDSRDELINKEEEEKKDKKKEMEGDSGKEEEDDKKSRPGDEPSLGVSTTYRLRGVVVHSGQASGGHYYSFIYLRWVGGGEELLHLPLGY